MKEVWYRADFNYVPENYSGGTDEYHCFMLDDSTTMEELDKKAIEWAKEIAAQGHEFSDVGHVALDLVEVTEVDGNKECFPEVRTIWW